MGQFSASSSFPSRREREREAKRREILQAAKDVFSRGGYHEATLDEIARHAELAKGTIYNYFSSKEDLFEGLLASLMDGMEALALQALETPGGIREKFTAYARALLRHTAENEALLRLVAQELLRQEDDRMGKHLRWMQERHQRIWGILASTLAPGGGPAPQAPFNPEEMASLFDAWVKFWGIHRPMLAQQPSDPAAAGAQAEALVALFLDGSARYFTKEQ